MRGLSLFLCISFIFLGTVFAENPLNLLHCGDGNNEFLSSPNDMDLGQLQSSFNAELDTVVMVHGFRNTAQSAKKSYQAIYKVMAPQIQLNYIGFSWPCDFLLEFGKGMEHAK